MDSVGSRNARALRRHPTALELRAAAVRPRYVPQDIDPPAEEVVELLNFRGRDSFHIEPFPNSGTLPAFPLTERPSWLRSIPNPRSATVPLETLAPDLEREILKAETETATAPEGTLRERRALLVLLTLQRNLSQSYNQQYHQLNEQYQREKKIWEQRLAATEATLASSVASCEQAQRELIQMQQQHEELITSSEEQLKASARETSAARAEVHELREALTRNQDQLRIAKSEAESELLQVQKELREAKEMIGKMETARVEQATAAARILQEKEIEIMRLQEDCTEAQRLLKDYPRELERRNEQLRDGAGFLEKRVAELSDTREEDSAGKRNRDHETTRRLHRGAEIAQRLPKRVGKAKRTAERWGRVLGKAGG
eukprot:TRINITY_DN9781_c0_g1_i1.p1 TRINITY_DN9781_c0_g1~~TRINITY_DN9781_c0_g1_i1.p1  ORF type:complete len:373 (-),score=58.43 TRINITY_DN9781_c0_g1_i1:43-1161(-)